MYLLAVACTGCGVNAASWRADTTDKLSWTLRCLDSSPVGQINDDTPAQLRCLHPAAPAPSQPAPHDAPPDGPAQVEADAFNHILLRLPRGTAVGLSGWTYEHVQAAGLYDKRTGEAMRGFVNDILLGAIPHSDLLR